MFVATWVMPETTYPAKLVERKNKPATRPPIPIIAKILLAIAIFSSYFTKIKINPPITKINPAILNIILRFFLVYKIL